MVLHWDSRLFTRWVLGLITTFSNKINVHHRLIFSCTYNKIKSKSLGFLHQIDVIHDTYAIFLRAYRLTLG